MVYACERGNYGSMYILKVVEGYCYEQSYTGSSMTHVHFLLHNRKFHGSLPLKQNGSFF